MSRHTSRDEQTPAALHLRWVVFDICVRTWGISVWQGPLSCLA